MKKLFIKADVYNELIEKGYGKRDLSKLTRKVITDKNGHRRTVFVRNDVQPAKSKNVLAELGLEGRQIVNQDYKDKSFGQQSRLSDNIKDKIVNMGNGVYLTYVYNIDQQNKILQKIAQKENETYRKLENLEPKTKRLREAVVMHPISSGLFVAFNKDGNVRIDNSLGGMLSDIGVFNDSDDWGERAEGFHAPTRSDVLKGRDAKTYFENNGVFSKIVFDDIKKNGSTILYGINARVDKVKDGKYRVRNLNGYDALLTVSKTPDKNGYYRVEKIE